MTNLVVLQPNYLPWRGTFDLIDQADIFVFLDDVQYTKNDWRNRNLVRQPDGRATWLTVPVSASSNTTVRDATIEYRRDWCAKHLRTLKQCYGGSVGFAEVHDMLARTLAKRPERLIDLTVPLTIEISRKLESRTNFLLSSELGLVGDKNERLVAIAKEVGATTYVSGPAARAYIEPSQWDAAKIQLQYYSYPDYPVYHTGRAVEAREFSIVDLLCFAGAEAPEFIWRDGRRRHRNETVS